MEKRNFLEAIGQDARYSLRGLRKSFLLVAVVSLSLGLGIGLNTTVYSLLQSILFRSATAVEPERLMRVEFESNMVSYENYRDLRDSLADGQVFKGLVAYTNNLHSYINWRSDNETTSITCRSVSSNFFDVLGVAPALGRTFASDESHPETNPNVVILTDEFWTSSLSHKPNILGSLLELNGQPFTVVGVLPPDYRPVGGPSFTPKIYLPISNQVLPDTSDRSVPLFEVIGRLAPNVSREQARAALEGLGRHLSESFPEENKDFGKVVQLYSTSGFEWLKQVNSASAGVPILEIFGVLSAFVILILLVACANVANLLLARGTNRGREIALRMALGATRAQVIRQLLIESLLLSIFATAFGLLITLWLLRFLGSVDLQLPLPIDFQVSPDWRLLLFGLLLAFFTSLVCGLIPAIQATKVDLVSGLKNEVRQFVYRRLTLRNGLVIVQVAISIVLLVSASLFLRNLLYISQINPGFDVNHTLTAYVSLIPHRYTPEQRAALIDKVVNDLSVIPGVASVSHSNFPPLTLNDWGSRVRLENAPESERFRVNIQFVGPNYFSTMGIKLLGGREFRQQDDKNAPKVVVLNETFAKQYFPGQNPVGKRLFGATKPIEIVGVVSDSKYRTLGEESRLLMYQPYQQGGDFWGGDNFCLLVRAEGLPRTVLSAVKNRLTDLDPSMSLEVKTMEENLSAIYAPSRMGALLLSSLAGLSLVLTVVGMYGVIAYTVARRTREFGIRMALGATRSGILRLVMTDGAILIGLGAALGVAISLAATRALASLLAFGISRTDTLSFLVAILVLALIGIGSNLIAARKAVQLDPMTALRSE